LIYPGGKSLLVPELIKVTPPHEIGLELFAGGGTWTLAVSKAKNGVLNDKNGEVYNFFRVLRDPESASRLREILRCTPYSRDEYFDCDKTWEQTTDSVERARKWFVVINMGFTHQEDSHSFRVGVSNGVARAIKNHVDDLPLVTDRLREVVIENLDFRKAMALYGHGADTCIFADPPYITAAEQSLVYREPFTVSDHWDLLVLLDRTDAKVVLCGYESELYSDMLRPPQWQLVRKIRVAQVGNSDYTEREYRIEHIWVKKPLGGLWG